MLFRVSRIRRKINIQNLYLSSINIVTILLFILSKFRGYFRTGNELLPSLAVNIMIEIVNNRHLFQCARHKHVERM